VDSTALIQTSSSAIAERPRNARVNSIIPHWKAPDRLPTSDKWTFTAEELQAKITPIQHFVKVVHHFDATFEVEGLVFPPTTMYS